MTAVVAGAVSSCASVGLPVEPSAEPARINNRSVPFPVSQSDVALHFDYTGFDTASQERFFHSEIVEEMLDMIDEANEFIVFSLFLFDSLLIAEGTVENDVVGRVTNRLVERRRHVPDLKVVMIFDPSHRAYGDRVSDAEKRLLEAGVDVFYSDLIKDLKKASFFGVPEAFGHTGRVLHRATSGHSSEARNKLLRMVKIPGAPKFDGEHPDVTLITGASLVKANHRKILVAGSEGGSMRALVSSSNPHNASASHVNAALSVRGPAAAYIYDTLRADMAHSISLGGEYTRWHDGASASYQRQFMIERFPPAATGTAAATDGSGAVTFVTEAAIPQMIVEMLEQAREGDEVRIQMFYLSYLPVLEAIVEASARVGNPVRLLLDANKDAFNREKDGTPNRQVARWLLDQAKKRGGEIQVRWYATHGEQNHAKLMSITNPATGKSQLISGSANWTGRNLAGVNMEANLAVEGLKQPVTRFNTLFDRFWSNKGNGRVLYSLDYGEFSNDAAADWKWRIGETPFYYSRF